MKVLTTKQDLTNALSLVVNKLGTRQYVMPFTWVRLKAAGSTLILQAATPDDIHLKLPVRAEVIEEGEACLNSIALMNFVESVTDEDKVELFRNRFDIVVKIGDVSQELPDLNPELCPPFPGEPQQYRWSLPSDILIQGVKLTKFAVAKKRSTNPLSYLCVDGRGDYTNFVASDGHRLVVVKYDYPSDVNVKLHRRSLNVLQELLKDSSEAKAVRFGYEDGKCYCEERFLFLTNDKWTLAVKDYSKKHYPLFYEALIAERSDVKMNVSVDDLHNALEKFKKNKRITLFFEEEGLRMEAFGEEVFVKKADADVYFSGEVNEETIFYFSSDFDPKMLRDFTQHLTGTGAPIEVRFRAGAFVAFKAGNYLYFVCPFI